MDVDVLPRRSDVRSERHLAGRSAEVEQRNTEDRESSVSWGETCKPPHSGFIRGRDAYRLVSDAYGRDTGDNVLMRRPLTRVQHATAIADTRT